MVSSQGPFVLPNLALCLLSNEFNIPSLSQYEAKLRSWGFRKNLKRKEWETQYAQVDGPKTPPDFVTSLGLVKDRKKIKRGERYLKQVSQTNNTASESGQTTGLTLPFEPSQRVTALGDEGGQLESLESIHGTPQSLQPLVTQLAWDSSSKSHVLPSLIPLSDLETSSGLSWSSANMSPPTTSTNQQLNPMTHGLILNGFESSETTTIQRKFHDSTSVVELGCSSLPDVDDSVLEPRSQFLALDNSSSPDQNRLPVEAGFTLQNSATQANRLISGRTSPRIFRQEWLKSLPFAKLETFLSSRGISFHHIRF